MRVAVLDLRNALAVAFHAVEEGLDVRVQVQHLVPENAQRPTRLKRGNPHLAWLLLVQCLVHQTVPNCQK